jgi:general secretion pathway protein K
MRQRGDETGYALVAAVAAILVFSLLALAGVSAMRAAVITGAAEVDTAEAAAAADAGIALGIHHLLTTDATARWSIDGRPRRIGFERAQITIRVEDERGKIPINLIEDAEITTLLEAVGLDGPRLRIARDSFLDWRDDDEEPRLDGAENAYYRLQRIRPRNGALLAIGELGRIRGFSPALVDRLRPAVTVNFGSGSFDPRQAHPLALGVMLGGGNNSAAAIARARELDGQRTAFDFISDADLVGRPLSIVSEAVLPSGARARRIAVIELTGTETRPYVVRSYS